MGSYSKGAEDMSLDHDRHAGVFAQDVQKVLPEAVFEIQNGKFLGVSYENLIPLLVESIRELDETAMTLRQELILKEAEIIQLQATSSSSSSSSNVDREITVDHDSCTSLYDIVESLHARIEVLQTMNTQLSQTLDAKR